MYPNFYDTQRVVAVPPNGLPTSHTERGDPLGVGTCPDECCKIVHGADSACLAGNLEAYYVTARGAAGAESPRSNLIFWKWGTSSGAGYPTIASEANSNDAIATFGVKPSNEPLACWNTDEPNPNAIGVAGGRQPNPVGPQGCSDATLC